MASSLRGISSKPALVSIMAAYCTPIRNVTFSPWPPTVIGGPPGCSGVGESMASRT
jgi:hypothetical protein